MQKLEVDDIKSLLTENMKNLNESGTAFQHQLDIMNKRMQGMQKAGNLSTRVQILEESVKMCLLLQDDIRAAQNASNIQLLRTSGQIQLYVNSLPKDCKELYEMGRRTSGVYSIYPWDNYDPQKNSVQVLCDMSTAGGGSTVIQNRVDGMVNFNRSWQEYKAGFGDVLTSYWIGNDLIHQLTKENSSSLYVGITGKNGTSFFIKYDTFSISGEDDQYRLYIAGEATGTLDDRMRYGTGGNNINGMKFSTFDKDNDLRSNNCTDIMGNGGWWFNSCSDAFLNGEYPPGKWEQPWYSTFNVGSYISSTRMMIKRK